MKGTLLKQLIHPKAGNSALLWWSGGVTSAVACKIALDLFDVHFIVMIDTENEHPDTYRFKKDCEKWYGMHISTISAIGDRYENIQDVWVQNKSLNVATGAICSTELKRKAREYVQKIIPHKYQVFGYEFDRKEMNRNIGLASGLFFAIDKALPF